MIASPRTFGSLVLALALALALAIAAIAPQRLTAQIGPESRPGAPSDSRPRAPGSPELLKKLLGEHMELRHLGSKESLARAAEIDRKLPDHDWSNVDVPGTAVEFAQIQEQRKRDRKTEAWDFDRLPPALVRVTAPEKWAAFVDQQITALTQQRGSISWKSPKGWRNIGARMLHSRAFEKIASHLATVLAVDVAGVPKADLGRIHDAFFRISEHYDLETVHKSVQYDYLPAGYYLQWGGWLGDRRAWKIATDMVDAWLAAPRESQEPNLSQAVRAIDLFNNRLDPGREAERAERIRRIREHPRIPASVKALLRP